jgi:osmotically-inducible protein OsmY
MTEKQNNVDDVRAALTRDARIPHPEEIAVAVRAGIATLRGSVGSFHQRRAAIEAARSVRGIGRVQDELVVDPRDRWDDNQIRGTALQALISSADVPDDRVDVAVHDAWLTLKGEVRHQHDSDAAFAAVRGVPAIGGITNRIVVITAGIRG